MGRKKAERYSELVHRLASAMAASGLKRGACAAYLGVNSPEMLALLFACSRLGLMFMPLNWRLAGPEHRQMLEHCPPSLLFVEPQFIGQTDAFRANLPPLTAVTFGQAAWTASWRLLGRATGAPKTAISPSPIIWLTMPP